ncbi:MAG TPA: hypothetical protein VGA80_14085 [Flavobacteriaceae bacterium]
MYLLKKYWKLVHVCMFDKPIDYLISLISKADFNLKNLLILLIFSGSISIIAQSKPLSELKSGEYFFYGSELNLTQLDTIILYKVREGKKENKLLNIQYLTMHKGENKNLVYLNFRRIGKLKVTLVDLNTWNIVKINRKFKFNTDNINSILSIQNEEHVVSEFKALDTESEKMTWQLTKNGEFYKNRHIELLKIQLIRILH